MAINSRVPHVYFMFCACVRARNVGKRKKREHNKLRLQAAMSLADFNAFIFAIPINIISIYWYKQKCSLAHNEGRKTRSTTEQVLTRTHAPTEKKTTELKGWMIDRMVSKRNKSEWRKLYRMQWLCCSKEMYFFPYLGQRRYIHTFFPLLDLLNSLIFFCA